MKGEGGEDDRVSRLEIPGQNAEFAPMGLDVRQGLELVRCHGIRTAEIEGLVASARSVGTSHELHRAVGSVDVVEGDPDRADLLALDGPVVEVLVPGGPGDGARLLHHQVVVEHVHARGAHEAAGGFGGW